MAGLSVSEGELLKEYGLTTLHPQRWEDTHYTAGSDTGGGFSHGDAHGEDWTDPLHLSATAPSARQMSNDERAQVMIGSKAFDPKVFLQTVHPEASFADLSRGAQQLRATIDQRSEALKVLVDENFDRFVSIKVTMDGVYREMSESSSGPLVSGADCGVRTLRKCITSASSRADQVFRPILENHIKAIKLRNTLGVFQRSHFFFNLPGSLNEFVEAGNYEAALRDYKKGKYLLETRPGQILPVNTENAAGAAPNEHQLAQQRRIFSIVWDAVEQTMYDMQSRLRAHLQDPQRSVEEQEKCIHVLLELDPETDPIANFLSSQHEHIGSLLRTTFEREQHAIEAARATLLRGKRDPIDQAKDLSNCLVLVRSSSGSKPFFNKALGTSVWLAIDDMIANVCTTVLRTMPTFWRIACDHKEGKFNKERPGTFSDSTIHKQAQGWAQENIQLFIKRIDAYFGQEPFRVRAKQPLFMQLPAWVPEQSCSLSTTYCMNSILGRLHETVQELKLLAIPGTAKELDALLLDTRFQFTEVLCFLWLRDAHLCYHMENWTSNAQQPAITSFLFSLSVFNRWNAREGFYIAEGRTKQSSSAEEAQVHAVFSDRLKKTFVSALYAFLDGIVTAATTPSEFYHRLEWSADTPAPAPALPDRDTRILLSVSNLSHLRSHVINAWVKQFEEAYHVSLMNEHMQLLEVCGKLDSQLLNDFVRRHGDKITQVMRRGILEDGVAWDSLPRPTSVSPFIFQALLLLVEVHAQIRATVPLLVSRAISSLVETMVNAAADAYSRVPTFNKGGMLQATLEIEFVHQTMAFHVTPAAENALKRMYESISQRYGSTPSGKRDQKDFLQKELESVKQTLIASRKATALEFLCFRRPKTGEAPDSSADAAHASQS
ncbi:Exocyst complex component S5 [Malassezia vespertilionis]|uniref:Exocyst complex component SEC5 n=1 Tax=Malassezia vespertilionis TaxID=2020962 RepID=A0A2N1JBU1_9BASI|nr:Exocyst complex component S5 [Malassezia vespertilionis]PKI84021.1 hypothetical protein MVES_001931 [Malassezia vespertilionis]WFD06687.1 Exocyst complex component S5 [Malassezia vespertilionis]